MLGVGPGASAYLKVCASVGMVSLAPLPLRECGFGNTEPSALGEDFRD